MDVKNILKPLALFFGLIISAYLIGSSLERFRTKNNQVTVKGIGEIILESDLAIWDVDYTVEQPTFQAALKRYNEDSAKVVAFLKKHGIPETNIQITSPKVNLSITRDEKGRETGRSYVIEGSMNVSTSDVKKVQAASFKTYELLEDEVFLNSSRYGANPKYILQEFDAVRPKLLEEAVKSAKKMAEKFAEHAGTKVGDIMKADQGSFSIKSIRGDYNEDAYMQKKVRVVSTITYGLRA